MLLYGEWIRRRLIYVLCQQQSNQVWVRKVRNHTSVKGGSIREIIDGYHSASRQLTGGAGQMRPNLLMIRIR